MRNVINVVEFGDFKTASLGPWIDGLYALVRDIAKISPVRFCLVWILMPQ